MVTTTIGSSGNADRVRVQYHDAGGAMRECSLAELYDAADQEAPDLAALYAAILDDAENDLARQGWRMEYEWMVPSRREGELVVAGSWFGTRAELRAATGRGNYEPTGTLVYRRSGHTDARSIAAAEAAHGYGEMYDDTDA